MAQAYSAVANNLTVPCASLQAKALASESPSLVRSDSEFAQRTFVAATKPLIDAALVVPVKAW